MRKPPGGVRRAPLEKLILDGLRQRLLAPELIEEFVAAYHDEVNRARRHATAARAGKERELAEVKRRLEKLIEALIEGYRASGLRQRLDELETRRAALEQSSRPIPRRPSGCTAIWPRSTAAGSSACRRRWLIPRSATRRSRSCAG